MNLPNQGFEFHAIVRPAAGEAGTVATGFSKSYETVAESLAEIPRLYIEPDGSFVWVSSEDVARKINGQVTDDGSQVMFVEFRGRALQKDIDPILSTLRDPVTDLQVQLLPGGEIIDESAFIEKLNSA